MKPFVQIMDIMPYSSLDSRKTSGHVSSRPLVCVISDRFHFCKAIFSSKCLKELNRLRKGINIHSVKGSIASILKGTFYIAIWPQNASIAGNLRNEFSLFIYIEKVNYVGGHGSFCHGSPENLEVFTLSRPYLLHKLNFGIYESTLILNLHH
jgi:hypothetical protein